MVVGQKPGLYAETAPQRVHVEDGQLPRKQGAKSAAIECNKNRIGVGMFDDTLLLISRRLDLFLALPMEKLEKLALQHRVNEIGGAGAPPLVTREV